MPKWNEIVPEHLDAIQGEHKLRSVTLRIGGGSFMEPREHFDLSCGKILVCETTATLLDIEFQPNSAAHLDSGFVNALTDHVSIMASQERKQEIALRRAHSILDGEHFMIRGTNGLIDVVYVSGPGVGVSCHLAELVQVKSR